MKVKNNSDNDLPLEKILSIYNIVTLIGSVFYVDENNIIHKYF